MKQIAVSYRTIADTAQTMPFSDHYRLSKQLQTVKTFQWISRYDRGKKSSTSLPHYFNIYCSVPESGNEHDQVSQ